MEEGKREKNLKKGEGRNGRRETEKWRKERKLSEKSLILSNKFIDFCTQILCRERQLSI